MDKQLPVSAWPEWKIIEKIGEGSFGKVYKAKRTEQGKSFYSAIKVITIPSSQSELNSVRAENRDDRSVREYFYGLVEECIQEVSTMEYFRGNSHVVSVEDYKVVEYLDDIGWDIFIRMEYLTSFLDYCAGKQLQEDEVIQLGIDLCKALEYCRKQNIIHRDIKPENIFVSRFGEFKLGDFGIARELERSMSGLSKKGTFSYMAPEMYRGESYDNRADIYSLGIVLYKLRNRNRLPFLNLEKQLITYRDKETALTRRMSGETLPNPEEASSGLAKVILKACAYKREERYQDAGEFRKALENLKYTGPVNAADNTEEENDVEMQVLKPDSPHVEERGQRELPQRRKKQKSSRIAPLIAAIIVMSVAVGIVSAVFVKLLMEDNKTISTQSTTVDNLELATDLNTISNQATEISENLSRYNWIGSEEEGKISYLNQDGKVMKVLVYPKLSAEGYYEEYYYWNGELFFAYIWGDEKTLPYLKEGQQKVNIYYYKNSKLIRWVDENGICHDGETDNEEYVNRGRKYWDQAAVYKNLLNS